jgi:hypothetical protein
MKQIGPFGPSFVVSFSLLMGLAVGLQSQTPKAAAPAPPAAVVASPSKPVSDADRADIREMQMHIKDLQRALQDAQQAMIAKISAITPKGYQLQETQQGKLEFVAMPEEKK